MVLAVDIMHGHSSSNIKVLKREIFRETFNNIDAGWLNPAYLQSTLKENMEECEISMKGAMKLMRHKLPKREWLY